MRPDYLFFPVVKVLIGKDGKPKKCTINNMEIPAKSVSFEMYVGEFSDVTITFSSDKIDIQYEQ